MAAESGPTSTCTPWLSTRLRALARPVGGLPSSSSVMSFTSRPASLPPCSSRKSWMPLAMSLPLAASGPVSGSRSPILIGPFCAGASAGRKATIAASATASTKSFRMSSPGAARGRRSGAERLEDILVAEGPAERRLHQAERETMHVLAVHRVHRIGRNHHPEVEVGGLEGRAEHASGGVDAGEDDGVGAEPAQQELQVGGVEGAVALLASHHQIARVVELGDDLGAGIAPQVVAQDAAAGLARIVMGGLPEGIDGNLGRIPVFRD